METTTQDRKAFEQLKEAARVSGIEVTGGKVTRTSSRFCLGVEHGDYNGTELFGVGTNRFTWLAYRPSGMRGIRLFSANCPEDGVVAFEIGAVPQPQSPEIAQTWGRFPYGVDYVLRREGISLTQGIDAVVYGDIPGGGMSRSASLAINLIVSLLAANEIEIEDRFKVVDMAQAVENHYIGAPCGQLDQVMILFARENMGAHYNPRNRTVDYVPLGAEGTGFRIVVMDTGTDRPGLEKSTYKVRRGECERLVSLLHEAGYDITCLADIQDDAVYRKVMAAFGDAHPNLCSRLRYVYAAQKRLYELMEAWKTGDEQTLGAVFRADGIGLRDDYKISGPELETMCDIARSVEGVLGERMLGGGDKGAAGALVRTDAVDALKHAIATGYPRSHPDFADRYAVHVCKLVDGVRVYNDAFGG